MIENTTGSKGCDCGLYEYRGISGKGTRIKTTVPQSSISPLSTISLRFAKIGCKRIVISSFSDKPFATLFPSLGFGVELTGQFGQDRSKFPGRASAEFESPDLP
jgi:hypothetical protein